MRIRFPIIIVLAVAMAASVVSPSVAAKPDREPGRAVDRTLLATLPDGARVSRERDTGLVRALQGGGQPLATARELGGPDTPAAAASAFLARFGGLYDLRSPGRDLRVTGVGRSGGAGTYVRYQQSVDGVPVLGGDLVVVVDRGLNVRAVRGETTRDPSVKTRPALGRGTAMRLARDAVARGTGLGVGALRADPATRWIFDPRLLDAPGLPFARLVWRTRVRDASGLVDRFVAVDARTGDVVLDFDQLHSVIPATANQRICDQADTRESVLDRLPCAAAHKLATPYTGEALRVAQATEATHDFFALRFGYDLPADLNAAAVLISTIRYCPRPAGGGCPYQNAFWDGTQMVYGSGFGSADDVVAHELGHAVTERASNLFYYMQSGAINEALSDIFGESVDQTNDHPFDTDTVASRWKMGEDLGSFGVLRNMEDPTRFGHPDAVDSPLWDEDPQEVDGGGVHSNSGVANRAFYLMVDGSAALDGDRAVAFDQALAIWYLAASRLLTTASDYGDLADSLRIACTELAGVADGVRDGSGAISEPIDLATDCGRVDDAIDAVRMTFERKPEASSRTPRCTDPDATAVALRAEPFDGTGSGWAFDANDANRRWRVLDIYGFRDPDASGPDVPSWHLHGADLARTGDRRVRQTLALAIPDGGRPVFLWFRHAFGFDDGSEDAVPNDRAYDGGVLEVSANGGDYRDIGSLLLAGRYGGSIWTGDTNPLEGRRAFVADSDGYAVTRANLSGVPGLSFAGTNARLSFRIGTDSLYGGEGWFIDDVWVYTCVNTQESAPPVLSDLRATLRTGTLSTAGRMPGAVRADVDGEGFVSVLVRVALGAGTPTAFGGSVTSSIAKGTFQASSQEQALTFIATDENGDEASLVRDIHARRFEE